MKNLLKTALLIGSLLLVGAPVQAASPALDNQETIYAGKMNNTNVRELKIFPNQTGGAILSWIEDLDNKFWLKTKSLRGNGTLWPEVLINKQTAYVDEMLALIPNINSNSKGQFFATWVKQSILEGKINQRVVGSTSKDGVTWSDPFVIIPNTVFPGDTEECRRESDRFDCGFTGIKSSIDDKGRLAVLVSRKIGDNKNRILATATSNKLNWPDPIRLGTVPFDVNMRVTGLSDGFATNFSHYEPAKSSAVYVNFWGWGNESWSKTMQATIRFGNVGVSSKWVQRNPSTLTLVSDAQELVAGMFYRNFDLKSMSWTGLSKEISPAKPNYVYQDFTATAQRDALTIGFTTYDQVLHKSAAFIATQNSLTGPFQIKQVATSLDQINPMASGFDSAGRPFFAYLKLQSGVGLASGDPSVEKPFPKYKESKWVYAMASDRLGNLFSFNLLGDAGIYEIGVIKGKIH